MAELGKWRKKRGHIQATITSLRKHIDNAEADEQDEPNKHLIEAALETATRSFQKFDLIQEQIEELDENEIEHRNSYYEMFNKEKARALVLMDRLENTHNQTLNNQQNVAPAQIMQSTIKLPPISFKPFDGTPEKWTEFFSLFKSVMKDQPIDAVQKLSYLKASLSGKAARTIEALELTNGNYEVAISILKDKYEHPRRMTRRHMSILREFPRLTKDTPAAVNELVDVFYQHTRALENLRAPVEFWDIPLVDLILSKLSSTTTWQWELTLKDDKCPSFKDLLKFLSHRANCAEPSQADGSHNKPTKSSNREAHPQAFFSHSQDQGAHAHPGKASAPNCPACNQSHLLYTCEKFRGLPLENRRRIVSEAHLCFNCFGKGHGVSSCNSQGSCRTCKRRHHTLLHNTTGENSKSFEQRQYSSGIPEQGTQTSNSSNQERRQVALVVSAMSNDIMVTSVLDILDKDGRPVQCRGLLDTCSTTNFITRRLADILKLKITACNVPVGALNSMTTYCTELATATIKSRLNDYKKTLSFLIVPTISHVVPDQPIQRELIKIPANIRLADPDFHRPAPVDLLLGAGTTLSLLSIGQIKLSTPNQQELYLQKTVLGWIIGGAAPSTVPTTSKCHLSSTPLDFDLQKFWEVEECPAVKGFTEEEEACEHHFRKHVNRDTTGRYVVALPFKPHAPKLGRSYHLTIKRFESTERRLNQNPDLKAQYTEVIRDYLSQQHMSPVDDNPLTSPGYYLPHHAVLKETSLTTKLRVVFDGSLKSSSGVSLNDVLYTGPTIQPDLFTILIRFRKHPIVITGDLKQMYRQFLVRKQDRKFQRILWRNPNKGLQIHELNTVTFGITCAAYLAIRCLHQLSEDEGESYPVVAPLLLTDFYVDDFLSGTKTQEEAKLVIKQMSGILTAAGLTMRQWASNDPSVLEGIPAEDVNPRLQLGDTTLKTLGIYWESSTDTITYTVNSIRSQKITKRIILSEVARIFDPLGLLAPVIILAKIILQNLWNYKLDWDESLPADLHGEWQRYCEQLPALNLLSFTRNVITADVKDIQLHGFSDASEKAYGACVYVRTIDRSGGIEVQLLCAKSRVAPIKTLTIPRLELCGALLLAMLMKTVKAALKDEIKTFYWTDSTIVLRWLRTSPQQLKTFAAHRVAEIQTITQVKFWRHVPTQDNPADLVSRGVSPADFPTAYLWKNGPPWLGQTELSWPDPELTNDEESPTELPERRRPICLINNARPFATLTTFSTLERMIRSLAYCFRFLKKDRQEGFLTTRELRHVEMRIIKCVQSQAFPEDMKILTSNDKQKSVSAGLLKLAPFLDQDGIMRVGGRLSLSNLPFDAKHPIVLPKNHHVTDLFIMYFHRKHLHTGVQQTLYAIRRKYWVIDGRSQVYKNLKLCCICAKAKPPQTEYVMGKLPKSRVNIANPFNQVGVDYCGPFLLKEKKFRNRVSIKSYVAVFVCMAVKAVHLELVTDLTADGFLSALRRFISRRGLCQDIYSDNGTNFVGANNILKELNKNINTNEAQNKIQGYLSDKGIQWHFNPPLAPHVGGLWEAAVKSFKKHLYHVAGREMLFTYEQFNTLVIEVEAILNSRPITTISSDPIDPIPLTPGHFLIGDSLTNLRGYDYTTTPDNRLSHWEHLQKVKQHFWNRWSREYLNELTVRTKWTKVGPEMMNGSIVLLREDNIPPAQWALGKIIECYPGSDGVVRTALVKTAKSSFVRNVKRLAILPVPPSNSEEKVKDNS